MRGIEYGMRRSLDDVVFGSMMSSVAICPSFSSFPHLSSLFLINIALSLYVCMCLSMRIYRLNIHSIKTDVPRQIVSLIYQFGE